MFGLESEIPKGLLVPEDAKKDIAVLASLEWGARLFHHTQNLPWDSRFLFEPGGVREQDKNRVHFFDDWGYFQFREGVSVMELTYSEALASLRSRGRTPEDLVEAYSSQRSLKNHTDQIRGISSNLGDDDDLDTFAQDALLADHVRVFKLMLISIDDRLNEDNPDFYQDEIAIKFAKAQALAKMMGEEGAAAVGKWLEALGLDLNETRIMNWIRKKGLHRRLLA